MDPVGSSVTTQQFVILSQDESSNGSLTPLGERLQVLADLFDLNTGPERPGDEILYGPGIRIELRPGEDPIMQMLMTVTEEEIGWQVIQRLAKRFQWKLLDPMSGREWRP